MGRVVAQKGFGRKQERYQEDPRSAAGGEDNGLSRD